MAGHGRAAVVTGGGRGLGRAIAERLAGEGMKVGLLARTIDDLETGMASIRDAGGEAIALQADVRDERVLKKALVRFSDWAGGLDALVCAAGRIRAVGPLGEVDPDDWWADMDTSVRGVVHSILGAMPLLRWSPAPSVSVLVGPGHNGPLPFACGYGAGQAALVRLVESAGREWAPLGIPIFAVNPGLVLTDLVRRLVDTPEGRRWLPEFNEALAEGKEVGPEAVAEMVAWLVGNRPTELSGRVVAAPLPPAILETRLARIQDEDRGVLRLR
jgi:NAD(P)-dependent dehydrogenase (short-subunit alcohol dehydrogenase family)